MVGGIPQNALGGRRGNRSRALSHLGMPRHLRVVRRSGHRGECIRSIGGLKPNGSFAPVELILMPPRTGTDVYSANPGSLPVTRSQPFDLERSRVSARAGSRTRGRSRDICFSVGSKSIDPACLILPNDLFHRRRRLCRNDSLTRPLPRSLFPDSDCMRSSISRPRLVRCQSRCAPRARRGVSTTSWRGEGAKAPISALKTRRCRTPSGCQEDPRGCHHMAA
jgi:hypothetical protein